MSTITIQGRTIGEGHPAYLIAELSANHGQDLDKALALVRAAKEAGADAIKLQTYRADTITLDCDSDLFRIKKGTIWEGRTLYALYEEAYTPWEWHAPLKELSEALGLHFFSSPFDVTAVDFLEDLGVPVYKIASFELVDLPLIRRVARTGKPMIMSTGMATLGEIHEAVETAREAGAREIALLKCNSAYPAPLGEMNLRTIPHMAQAFGVPVGLSDHTLGTTAPTVAVAVGACIVEKHFILDRGEGGPDSAFSLEPAEFKAMVDSVRAAEALLGHVSYQVNDRELASTAFRRSLFVVEDIKSGEAFTGKNIRSIRPAGGLHTRYLELVLEGRASENIPRGTPLDWKHLRLS
jgi:N-acetylneuraminate synthase